ncbi:uncharacterized protein N7477_007432 [Penicillium maclennaniae]|uniref:uncharacterized protein n=1 Tax=Penicillium maclennaniae TaxID=1343394 RepID=UPI0025420047|nr:uncharacterized protein N7477_007432 [Penicillium maclennaniae]KAJ5664984.1 hypothetical protein N7477_007432 [Penicillium maclennaniae]
MSSARPGPGPGPGSQSQSQSQVTASVIKFRCLYTHDLRRKSKRWQDGYLKYHTFNKRIMVYDEQGNYIGDHHWRSVEEVQDGDELELDKGALIQVGERMSTTQTDLSGLLEKRKSSQDSPQANVSASHAPHASMPRSSSSSQPFRSLNDLLGIKKTPIGHLVLPYEERHPPPPSSENSLPSQRAPKRPKVAPPKPLVNRSAPAEVVDLTEPEEGPPAAKSRKLATAHEMPRTAQRPRNPALVPQPPPETRRENPIVTGPQRPAPLTTIRSSTPPEKAHNLSSTTTTTTTSTPLPQRSDPALVTKPPAPSEKARSAPRAMNSRRPELPQFPDTSMPPGIPQDISKTLKPQVKEPPRFANPPVPPEPPRDARIATDLQRPEPPKFVKPPLPACSALSSRSQKPERTAAKDMQTEPLGARKIPNENLPVPPRTTSNTSSSEAPIKTLRMATEKPRKKLMYSALLPSDPSQKSSSRPSNIKSRATLRNLDSQAATTPAHQVDSTNAEFLPSDSTQFILDAMADSSNLGATMTQPPNLPARRALDAPLRKSLSVPTALTARQTLQSRPTLMRSAMSALSEQPDVNEEGPWTSEALDLFDFWPPGRPKPI